MKKITLLCSAIILAFSVTAQENSQKNLSTLFKLRRGNQYRLGIYVEQDLEKAFALYQKCAAEGSARAMNYLGMMYKEGKGCGQSNAKAIEWFTAAGEKGFGKALYNLALMHKFGVDVKMDYEKAFECFLKSAEADYSGGMYGAGYMLYRGQGVEQNYENAVMLFKKGAEMGRPSCMYNLGVCYRNGYGIEKDIEKAKYWLVKADSTGYQFANDELNTPLAETNGISSNPSKKEKSANRLKKFQSIKKNKQKIKLKGKWGGTKITYDFSGEHIIETEKISLDLFQDSVHVYGKWEENDSIKVDIEGTIADNSLHFAKGNYKKEGRYKREWDWQLQQGRFELQNINGRIVLCGNLVTFSPQMLEPGKPVYIELEKEPEKKTKVLQLDSLVANEQLAMEEPGNQQNPEPVALEVTETYNTVEKAASTSDPESIIEEVPVLKVYPNPFSGIFNLEYTLHKPGKVNISLYDMHGRLVHVLINGNKPEGTFRLAHDGQNLANGTYLVRMVVVGAKTGKSQLIIKIN